ncbi:MAG TPA: TonB-dependent receptor, partial [Gemmatimonadaceae bacterium]|nr:TonB-dependent receptor [Gemmatimonadaceae bacterium]
MNVSRVVRCITTSAIVALALPHGARAQKPDSTKKSSDTLEAVVVKAVRSTLATPAAQSTMTREEISKTFVGQDVPNFLNTMPSMTSYSDAGGYSGYSYLRLRGIDQTRINITLDGVPLNDPEDQVLYFSNVPDFLNSIQSVQIQRGVGSSTFGTASYAGSMNFQSVPLATTPRGGDLQLTGGSFNTMSASAQYATGISDNGFAAYARISKLHTDGYREHSGNDSQSAFVSGGWFGVRDAVKFTGFDGVSGTREAYDAASEADLAIDRRTNPLTPAEGDRFHQEMASLSYTHAFLSGATLTTTAYRNSAAGAFDVVYDPTETDNFYLAHVWYGVLSALSIRDGDLSLDFGLHLSNYHRMHADAIRPDLNDRLYTNIGYKYEQSAFAKAALDRGPFRFSVDLQLRDAQFRYQPDPNAGITSQSVSWTFLNPKAGITWHGSNSPLTIYASFGHTSREPARNDLFDGADDLNSTNAASILPLTRVKPEVLNDYELGATWTRGRFSLNTNLFAMEFRNELAAIGQLSLTGNPLTQNVAQSYRRGVEFDGSWRISSRVTSTSNLTVMQARIIQYFDAPSGNTYNNVEPLLTPPVIANEQLEMQLSTHFSLIAAARYVDRSHLANDGNDALVVPAWWMLNGTLAWHA